MRADERKISRIFNCWRFFAYLNLVLFCICGVAISVFALYLFLIQYEAHVLIPKIVVYFLLVPGIFTVLTTFVGWNSIGKKNDKMVKVFAVLIGTTVVLEVGGSLWCFGSLQKSEEEISVHLNEVFLRVPNKDGNNYWNKIQAKYKCCGLNGPADYRAQKLVPYSCCGSDMEKLSQGDCLMIWQKGCVQTMSSCLQKDLIKLALAAFFVALLQIPGIFVSWCFSKKIIIANQRKKTRESNTEEKLMK